MKSNTRYCVLFSFIILLFFHAGTAFAQDESGQNSEQQGTTLDKLVLSIEPVFPENQVDKSLPYFDLQVSPNTQENLKFKVINNSEEMVKGKLSFHTARTGDGGTITYSDFPSYVVDKSLIYDLEKNAKFSDEQIELGPKQTKEIGLTLDLPKESFKGVLLGGVHLDQKMDFSKHKGNIKNQFSLEMAVRLFESDKEVPDKFTIADVDYGQQNYRNRFTVRIQNAAPKILSGVDVDTSVYKKSKSTELYNAHFSNIAIAPNTNFICPINLSGKAFVPGDYTIKTVIKTGSNTYKYADNVTVTKENAEKYNEKDFNIEQKNIPWTWIIAGTIVIIVLIIIVFVLVYKNKKIKKTQMKK